MSGNVLGLSRNRDATLRNSRYIDLPSMSTGIEDRKETILISNS
jgi:hypothetical protein